MIVCSCARVSDRELRAAVKAAAKTGKPVSFRAVYRQMGKRARCGNCRPLINQILQQAQSDAGFKSRRDVRAPS